MRTSGRHLLLLLALQALSLRGASAGAARTGRARSRLQDGDDALGSPGELAWQAWLLMDGAATAEAGGPRRITPKSVFIAPAFAPQTLPPCADGHKRDAAGRCVQVVHINRDAQLSFLLQRLNALHARPAPGRLPLPLPARVQDAAGPFKVPLRVPLPTSSTSSTTAAADPSPATEPAPAPAPSTEEPPQVSVVMADMSKRSSGEQAEATSEPAKPLITVWTVENDTLHKSQDVDGEGAALSVELPAASSAEAAEGGEEEKEGPKTSEVSPPLADVPEDALPMLVISPGTAAPDNATTPTPAPSNGTAQGEGSGEPSDAGGVADDDDGPGAAPPEESEDGEDDDGGETGSADVMEHIEVVPISENSRHNLPIMGEDQDQDTSFSQAGGAASGFSGMFRPIPLEVIRSSPTRDEAPPAPQSLHVRFPSESGERDEPHTVHFFKGNYIKFPTEHAYRYKHRPVTEEFSDAKQTFWWIPSGWRIEQQRHQQPASQDFWPRTSFSEDPSLFSQYNPSYHSPLPYQQRQAQYDPQWSSMRRQMTS
uniref:Folded gastrulation n=1 Tax=Gryllus bimaculatus TaxID=6999 RepID=A0A5J6D129_GRYBI|nr:folded gastrulation [Gryllus bimaculatus]